MRKSLLSTLAGAAILPATVLGPAGAAKTRAFNFTETTYYLKATATSDGSFRIGAPDASGVAQLTGRGRDTGGTGKLKGFTSKYTYVGTFNLKTLVFKVVIKGRGSTT